MNSVFVQGIVHLALYAKCDCANDLAYFEKGGVTICHCTLKLG